MSDAAIDGLRARRLTLGGTYNVRDVGGYRTLDGGITRAGMLLRSDSLHGLDDPGQRRLASLGLRTVVDLRDPGERQRFPSPPWPGGVRTVHAPLSGAVDASIPTGPEWSLADAYLAFIANGDRVSDAVRALAAPGAMPVLVHCMAGKDRTGVIVALVLAAVGVPDELVIADFAASGLFLGATWRRDAVARAVARGVGVDRARQVIECRPEHMTAVLDELRRRYGGAGPYLEAQGVSDTELARLRAAIVAGA